MIFFRNVQAFFYIFNQAKKKNLLIFCILLLKFMKTLVKSIKNKIKKDEFYYISKRFIFIAKI